MRHRLSTNGPWRVVLPGIYMSHKGELTIGQREIAAVLYAGRGCMITGTAALRRQGVRVPLSDIVEVLIPATTRRTSIGFVHVHRTSRMPERPWRMDGMLWAPPARAVADAARGSFGIREVRAFAADAVQRRTCTVAEIATEVRAGAPQGASALRAALEEVTAGIRSVAEGDLRKLIISGRLPEPLYNPRLFASDIFLAQPDAWWGDAGVAVEVDSREWHLLPPDLARTQARQSLMTAHGILVQPFAPSRIRADGTGVLAEIRAALERAGTARRWLSARCRPGSPAQRRETGRDPAATFRDSGASLKRG